MTDPTRVPALVADATRRSDLVWLAAGAEPPTAAWHVWHDGAACLVTGPGEQPLPGILAAPGIIASPTAAVTVRSKATGGRIVTWEARVEVLAPRSPEWDAAAAVLLVRRLNLPDLAGATDRWARQCTVLRLTPTGRLLAAGATIPP